MRFVFPSSAHLLDICFVAHRYIVDDEVKYLKPAMELLRPERNTLTVSLTDVEDFSTKLTTLIQEHYFRWVWRDPVGSFS